MAKATPQLEDGFVRFATEWLEAFIRAEYPGSVKEFVLVIARETWGWNETWREIPMPRIAELLGVSVGRAKQLRDEAVRRQLVEWEAGRGPGRMGRYRVQKDYTLWIPHGV
ncbi:MAG TPA: replication protein, partial [Candidatus Cryosericum sp.]|nr:replication protein [Candidatus Cryosericum sp.]